MVWHINQWRGGRRATCSPLPRRLPKSQHEPGPSSRKHLGNLRSRSPLESQRRGLESYIPGNEPQRRERSPLARRRRSEERQQNRKHNVSRHSLRPPSEFEESFEEREEKEESETVRRKESEKRGDQRGQQQQQRQEQQREQKHRLPGQRAHLSRKPPSTQDFEKDPRRIDATCLEEISRLLVEALGDEKGEQVRPLFLKYCRLHLFAKNISPGQKREVLTLIHGLDRLVQRDLLGCADLLVQRLKAIELVLNGASWQVAQNIELVPLDQERISSVAEAQEAARLFKSDFKVQREGSRKRFRRMDPERGREGKDKQREERRKRKQREGGNRSSQDRTDAPPLNHPDSGSPLSRRVGVGSSPGDSQGRASQGGASVPGARCPGHNGGQQSLSLEVGFTSDLLGRYLLEQVLGRSSSSSFGYWASKSCEWLEGLMVEGSSRKADVFPLPLPMHPALADDSWMVFLVLSLNYMHGGQRIRMSIGPGTDIQRSILDYLRDRIQLFTKHSFRIEPIDWKQFYQVHGISYSGEEVKVAKWTSWANVEPALPFGHIGYYRVNFSRGFGRRGCS